VVEFCMRGGDEGDDEGSAWLGTTRHSGDMPRHMGVPRRRVLEAPWSAPAFEDEGLRGGERPRVHALARWPVSQQRRQRDGWRH
jgi:hypothetical protein